MRGVPRNPVSCLKCSETKAAAKDRLCHSCRMKSRPNSNRRFVWDDHLDARLTAAHARSSSRQELTRNLDALQYSTGFTRIVLISRAARLGISYSERRSWSVTELDFLHGNIGSMSVSLIARKLSRSYYSVKAQIARQELCGRVLDGYAKQDLAQVLGVGRKRVDFWLARGFLICRGGRIPEHSVLRFLKNHPEEYRLGFVDEAWFKGLLFPSFGRSIWGKAKSRTAPMVQMLENANIAVVAS